MADRSPDLEFAGRVGRPHGLDGSFTVAEPWLEVLEHGGELVVAGRPRRIVRRAGVPARPIVRLDGVHDREGAEALRGEELLVARERAPALGQDEWWAQDLEGCGVVDGARAVGRVRRLLALPSCEVLEVERVGAVDLLVPLIGDAVRAVDVKARRIDVDLRFLGET